MIEWVLFAGVYLLVAVITLFIATSSNYKLLLDKPLDWAPSAFSEQENIAFEMNRRAHAAVEAKKFALVIAIFWLLAWPIEFILLLGKIFNGLNNKLSIERHDREFQMKLEAIKTKKILDEYEAAEKAKFDSLVN